MIRTVKDYEKLSEQYNKMLEERNSLIDDLSWYKAKISRLERHNKDLRLQSDIYFEQLQEVKEELQEVYFKAETLNKIIDIVRRGRSLGRDIDSEIILRAIEHELKYVGG